MHRKKRMNKKPVKIGCHNVDFVLLILGLIIFISIIIHLFPKSQVTGLVIGETPLDSGEEFSASAANENNILNTDIQVWQGQYYKGTEFQVGTYEFNFTVYDAKMGGGMLLKYNYFNNW